MNATQRSLAFLASLVACVSSAWGGCGGTVEESRLALDGSTESSRDDGSADAVTGTDRAATADAELPDTSSAGAGEAGSCGSAGSELDGGCGDPETDPHNCGSCGHDCFGGMCEAGTCLPLTTGVLATGQYMPSAIAVDGVDVYWVNAGTPLGGSGCCKQVPIYVGAQVLRCAITGCGNAPTVLASLPPSGPTPFLLVPSTLTLDATKVYWADGTSIRSCAKTGCDCTPTILAAAQSTTGVAVTSSTLFFTEHDVGEVATCSIGGCPGAPTLLATSQVGPTGIALDTTDVYWTTNSTVVRCSLGGCNGVLDTLWHGQTVVQANTTGIAVDATNVYWTNAQPFNLGSVMQCAKANCAGTLVTLAAARTEPLGIAVDGENVYWTESAGVMKCAIGGCTNSPTVLASSGSPAIALDGAHAYFTQPGSTTTDGRIMMIAK